MSASRVYAVRTPYAVHRNQRMVCEGRRTKTGGQCDAVRLTSYTISHDSRAVLTRVPGERSGREIRCGSEASDGRHLRLFRRLLSLNHGGVSNRGTNACRSSGPFVEL